MRKSGTKGRCYFATGNREKVSGQSQWFKASGLRRHRPRRLLHPCHSLKQIVILFLRARRRVSAMIDRRASAQAHEHWSNQGLDDAKEAGG
jgi:hypothetical protein